MKMMFVKMVFAVCMSGEDECPRIRLTSMVVGV